MDKNAVSVRELKFLCVGNDYFHVSETIVSLWRNGRFREEKQLLPFGETIISLRRNCQLTRLCVSGDTVRGTSFYSVECMKLSSIIIIRSSL